MVDIVDLRIEAENLASERLVQVANDVQGLGRTANIAQEQLDDLEITQQSLNSFIEARRRVSDLESEVSQATVALDQQRAALRANNEATDEQRIAVAAQATSLRGLRSDLTRTNTEYRTLRESLRAVGVNTQAYRQEQERLTAETATQRVEAQRLSQQYDTQTDRLREQIAVQRTASEATERQEAAQRGLRQEAERAGTANAARLAATRRETEEQGRVTIATARYEAALRQLNAAQAAGTLTRGNYIRSEARLRSELALSASQTDISRRAIEADSVSKDNNRRGTDALTSVTRRLAQAYTVLIAAQQTAAAVGGNVTAYGALEAAITDVERTTGIARGQVVALADELRTLGAEVTPTTSAELLRFAEIAGQLGTTSTEDILLLVNAAEQLGVATNIAGDEAATLLSRILQSTGEGIPAIGNLSSSIVELGNNFAAREDEIVNFTREIVTATRDINLGSAAAAGLGTTLAVAGQRAEASRTAIGRLSQEIRRAGTEGGESLERLGNITGQTADQLQENLGERSEQIILDFVRGLARVQSQGGVTLDVLRQFGIDGQEAAGVFNGLAANVGILEQALDSSTRAYADGLAQVREAANVYANQESAIGRLSNQFSNLREELGRAFSDETNLAVDTLSDGLDGVNDEVIELFEILPDLVVGLGEFAESLTSVFSLFGTDGSGGFQAIAETLQITFNLLDSGINAVILGFQNLIFETVNAGRILAETFGSEFDTEYLDGLAAAMEDTRNRIRNNNDDIADSYNRLNGESSRSFTDLQDTVERYGGAIARLSEQDRIAIQQIIEKNGFVEGQDQLYRQLTERLVRANRAQTIEIQQTALLTQAKQQEAAARREQITAIADSTQAVTDEIVQNNTLDESRAQLQARLREVNKELAAGNITKEEAAGFTAFLTTNLNLLAKSTTAVAETQAEQRISAQELLTQVNALYDQYAEGALTLDQVRTAEAALQSQFEQSNVVVSSFTETTNNYTDAQLRTQNAIQRSLVSIAELRRSLADSNITAEETIRLNGRLAQSERELQNLRREEALQAELAASSFAELNRQRDIAEQQLARLTAQFEAGAITAGEYARQQEELVATISAITALTGDNTAAVASNTVALEENNVAKTEQIAKTKEATTAVSLELQAYERLNTEFDFTGDSTAELAARVDQLNSFIVQNNRVTSVWLRNLAQVTNQGFEREQQFIRETLALRDWQQQVESGNLSLKELDDIAIGTQFNIRALGDEQLTPLRNAIATARQEFQDLNDTITDALSDTQDRLDRIRGDEAAIVQRQFARERDELTALLEEATTSGNAALVAQVRQALSNLITAQDLELRQQTADAAAEAARNNSTSSTSSNNDTNNTSADRSNGGSITITLNTPNGVRTVQVADQASANALLATFEDFGTVSQQGNV